MSNDGLLNLVLVVLLYLATLLWMYVRHPKALIGLFGIGLYVASGFCALVYFEIFGGKWLYTKLPLGVLVYLWAASVAMLSPLFRIRDDEIRTIAVFREDRLCFCLWILAAIVLFTNVSVLPQLLTGVKAAWQGYAQEIYDLRRSGNMAKVGFSFSFRSACFTLAGMFSELVVFFFFWALSGQPKRRLSMLLGVCSLFPALASFASAGRNGLVAFGMNIVCLWLLFRNLMSRKIRHAISMAGVLVLSATVTGIVVVTLARFGTRGSSGVWESVFRYAGQPMLNFAFWVPEANGISCGDNTFPAIRMGLGLSHIMNRDGYRAVWENTLGIPMNVFYTTVGDFVLDYGWLGTMAMMACGGWVMSKWVRQRRESVELSTLFLIYALFLVAGHGIFYFTYKTFAGNLRVLAMVVTYFALSQLLRARVPQRGDYCRGA